MGNKEIILNRLKNSLRGKANDLKDDTTLKIEDKLEQMEIIINLKEYLDNYDEYQKVLNRYTLTKERLIMEEKE